MSETVTYRIDGMTCGHCTSAVESELARVAGVDRAVADLETKLVTVTGSRLDDEALRAAIEEAGYEVTE